MSPRPLEIARDLGVTPKDAEAVRISRRKAALTGAVQSGLAIIAAVAGYVSGNVLNPQSGTQDNSGYPYAFLWSAPALSVGMHRRRWIATLVVAAAAFLVFFLMTWNDSAGTYGTTTRYGVYYRS